MPCRRSGGHLHKYDKLSLNSDITSLAEPSYNIFPTMPRILKVQWDYNPFLLKVYLLYETSNDALIFIDDAL